MVEPVGVCLRKLPPPLSATWNGEVITGLAQIGRLTTQNVCSRTPQEQISIHFGCFGIHEKQKDILSSKCPVILNLFLFFSLIFLAPAFGAQSLPGCVAIKTTSFLAEELRLVKIDPSPLANHLLVVVGETGGPHKRGKNSEYNRLNTPPKKMNLIMHAFNHAQT